MILQETYTLSNGVEIPKLGLGTWMMSNDDVVQAVIAAAKIGYRHVDTAQAYHNEQGVGEGLRQSGVRRDELFVTTKIDAGLKSHDEAAASIDASLAALGLDYVDLMLIHSPRPWDKFRGDEPFFAENRAVWAALEEAYGAGKLRAIGLSNVSHFRRLFRRHMGVPPGMLRQERKNRPCAARGDVSESAHDCTSVCVLPR